MQIFSDLSEWLHFRDKLVNNSLGFVPTMGALHSGHLSLVKKSLDQNLKTLVSIYINPTQFNNSDDLKNYPVDLDADIQKLEEAGADYLLLPNKKQIYPDDYSYQVQENELSLQLCGKNRPGHFTGVLTIVMKLLNLARADKAYFGEKDFQQLAIVKKMVSDLALPITIVPVRELTIIFAAVSAGLNSKFSRVDKYATR